MDSGAPAVQNKNSTAVACGAYGIQRTIAQIRRYKLMAAKKESSSKQLPTGPAGDKKAALETALAQIEKQFGKGAVMNSRPLPLPI